MPLSNQVLPSCAPFSSAREEIFALFTNLLRIIHSLSVNRSRSLSAWTVSWFIVLLTFSSVSSSLSVPSGLAAFTLKRISPVGSRKSFCTRLQLPKSPRLFMSSTIFILTLLGTFNRLAILFMAAVKLTFLSSTVSFLSFTFCLCLRAFSVIILPPALTIIGLASCSCLSLSFATSSSTCSGLNPSAVKRAPYSSEVSFLAVRSLVYSVDSSSGFLGIHLPLYLGFLVTLSCASVFKNP